MEDAYDGHRRKRRLQTLNSPTGQPRGKLILTETDPRDDDGDGSEEECCDPAVWNEFAKRFSEVQTVLDRNRVLIQQVNENQQSRMADNLVKNVRLIQEINGNIARVVDLYSDLSENFLSLFRQRQGMKSKSGSDHDGEKEVKPER